MPEVQVLDDDLNGLGWTIKSLVDENLKHPEIERSFKRISGALVITEKDADVTVTLLFRKGEPAIRNGAVEKPTATLTGGFEELSEIISGQVGPVRALLTGRIKARGNLIKLLIMARALISRDKS